MYSQWLSLVNHPMAQLMLCFCCLLVAAGSKADAPVIHGSTDVSITLDGVVNVAVADDAVAQVIVGSFMEGQSQGNFKSMVSAGFITNTAAGTRACAQVIIGSVTGNLPCLTSQ